MTKLILGSQSPRRKEIFLSHFTIPFEQHSSPFDEKSISFEPGTDPVAYATFLAQKKGEALVPSHPEALIVASDTIVEKEGVVYEKPRDPQEALNALMELQGGWHQVISALSLHHKGRVHTSHETTSVLFNSLTEEEILRYLKKGTWTDKAAGYGIQEGGGILVKKIDGCFYNVMGLPVNALRDLLQKEHVDLWEWIR